MPPTHAIDSRLVPLAQIEPNPEQPRKLFDPAELDKLKSGMKERGLICPISLQELGPGRYRILAGERRFRAAKELAWDAIDARIWPAVLSAEESRLMALEENLQRVDLNPIELAKGYKELNEAPYNLTQEEIAERLGITDPTQVSRYISLLDLPDEVQEILAQAKISVSHCKHIRKLTDPTRQIEVARLAADKGWTEKQTEKHIRMLLGKKASKRGRSSPSLSPSTIPDPLAHVWPALQVDPAIGPQGTWAVTYDQEGRHFHLRLPELSPVTEIAAWMENVAKALKTTGELAQEANAEQAFESQMPKTLEEFKRLEAASKAMPIPTDNPEAAKILRMIREAEKNAE